MYDADYEAQSVRLEFSFQLQAAHNRIVALSMAKAALPAYAETLDDLLVEQEEAWDKLIEKYRKG